MNRQYVLDLEQRVRDLHSALRTALLVAEKHEPDNQEVRAAESVYHDPNPDRRSHAYADPR
jgi:hypothetical protein